jgi:dimethylaniline monooxygenase (N-oxide forming)
MKKIAIIGGGFRGVGCLKVLKDKGYEVDLYEKNDDVGGVWHPSNNYKGLRIHTPAKLNQFENFPYPDNIDLTERLESKQVYQYLKSYVDAHHLNENMIFKTPIHKIEYNSKTKKTTLVVGESEYKTKEYDFVINTNGYCDRHIPDFKDAKSFEGEILHSYEANEEKVKELIENNKKVTIVGAGKTATDLVTTFRRLGYKITWLYRTPYWFLRYKHLHDNLRESFAGKTGHFFFKSTMLLGFMLSSFLPSVSCLLWRACGNIHTYGKKHHDYRKFHVALVDDGEMELLKETSKYYSITGEIDRFEENGYYTKDNQYVESDAVICCTGSSGTKCMSDITVDGEKLDLNTVFKSYRGKVIPQVPNLIFTAYHHFAMGLGDGEIQAKWIANYIESGLTPEELDKKALKFKHPFFTKLILFDTQDFFFPSFMKLQLDFIHNFELNPIEYVAYVYNFFLNAKDGKPLTIYNRHKPKAQAEVPAEMALKQ